MAKDKQVDSKSEQLKHSKRSVGLGRHQSVKEKVGIKDSAKREIHGVKALGTGPRDPKK